MRYELSSTPSKLRPKAAIALSSIGSRALHFAGRGQRHPLGIFNLTFSIVVGALRATLDELDTVTSAALYASPANYDWSRPLLTATDHLLDSIVQHLDSYPVIVEAFFEDARSNESEQIKK